MKGRLGAARVPRVCTVLLLLAAAGAPWAQAQTYRVVYNLQGGELGSYPGYGALVQDAAGNLYGTTSSGGSSDCGTIFKLAAGTGAESVLHSFTCQGDGGYPYSGVILSGNMLYGTTTTGGSGNCQRYGCGVVFAYNMKEKIVSAVHAFLGLDGAAPYAGLVRDSQGYLYGTSSLGGANDQGTVYRVNPKNMKVTVLHSFSGPDGAYPYSGLILDSTGTILYGNTYQGGTSGYGVAFSVAIQGGAYSTLYNFSGAIDGANPLGTMALDSTGNLYGTAANGGSGSGVVFQLPSGGGESVLYTFSGGGDGANPSGGVVRDSQGNLYGTTYAGGANSYGTVFQLSQNTLTVLHSFDNADGEYPLGTVHLDSKGNLFGTTNMGGSAFSGVVWEITP